jgi:protein-L-isoaspartate(D-aspartate) O-methyltransferase
MPSEIEHVRTERLNERAAMIERQLRERGLRDERVLAAMAAVPREAFVLEAQRAKAYADSALPLGFGQTISQPYMVARAADLAQLTAADVILEVGLGSGYQAAVLSQLCARVIGIEIVPELAQRAMRTLAALGFDKVSVQSGDGSIGYEPDAPYDAIVVAAGAPSVPEQLVAQLKLGGRLVIPVGAEALQTLSVITRTAAGSTTQEYDACVYVPLRGAAGRA